MQDLVTELQVARIVQWMLRPAAVALWLGTLIVPLHTQTAPPPPAPAQIKPAQIKDVQIPKLNTPPRLEQFLGGASRADLRRIDDFRQRQPGDGVPVSRKTSAWIGYDDRNFYAVFRSAVPRRRLAGRPAPHRRFPPAPARRRRARQPQNFRLDRLRRSELLRGLRLRRAARPDTRPPVQTRGHHERRPGRRLLRYLPLGPAWLRVLRQRPRRSGRCRPRSEE